MDLREAFRSLIMLFPSVRKRKEFLAELSNERDMLIYSLSQAQQQVTWHEEHRTLLTNQVMFDRGLISLLEETVRSLEEKLEYLFPFKVTSLELESELKLHAEALRTAIDQAESLEAQVSGLRASNGALEDMVRSLEEKVQYLFPFKEAAAELGELRALVVALEARNGALDYENEAHQSDIRDLEALVGQLRATSDQQTQEQASRIADLNAAIARLEADLARAKSRQMTDAADKADLRETISALETDLQSSIAMLATLRAQNKTLQADLEGEAERRHQAERRMHNITSAVAASEVERQALEERLASALKAQAASRLELRAAKIELETAQAEFALEEQRRQRRDRSELDRSADAGLANPDMALDEERGSEALHRALGEARKAAQSAGSLLRVEISRAKAAEAEIERLQERITSIEATARASDNMVQIEHARAQSAAAELKELRKSLTIKEKSGRKGRPADADPAE